MAREELPLSAAQYGIWLGQQVHAASSLYNTAEYVVLNGLLDRERVQDVIQQVLNEAETLHGRIMLDAGLPTLLIDPQPWQVEIIDFSAAADPEQAALKWMHAERAKPCDLEHDRWFGTALLVLGEQQTWWYLRVHHIALDGYSFGLLLQRVAALYSNKQPLVWGELRTVLEEDQAYIESEQYHLDQQFWLARADVWADVCSISATTALPQPEHWRCNVELPADLQTRLSALLPRKSLTWVDSLLAIVAAWSARWSGTGQMILGLPIMGRLGSASLRVPCMAMNIVPLIVTLDPAADLVALTEVVAAERSAMRLHTRYRYEYLRRELGLVGGGRRLFGPVVNIMPFQRTLSFGPIQAHSKTLNAGPVEDLAFNLIVREQSMCLSLEANPACYSSAALDVLVQDFQAFIDLWLNQPQLRLLDHPLPHGSFSAGGVYASEPTHVIQRLIEQARTRPQAIALVAGEHSWTYAEVLQQAGAWSAQLVDQGVQPGDLVGLALERSADAIIGLLAILMAGAAYLPLDPQWPNARLHKIVEQAQPRLLLTTQERGVQFDVVTPWLDIKTLLTDCRSWQFNVNLAASAYVMYTSGSTGEPKGVVVEHAALASFVQAAIERYEMTTLDQVLQFAPLHFDASIEEIFVTLSVGATLVLRDDQMLESFQQFVAGCAAQAISVLDLPTAFWHELVDSLAQGMIELPPCIRTVIIGGEAALPERVRAWLEAVAPHVTLFNTYGPTEATVVATVAELRTAEQAIPIGRPLAGVQALVLDTHGRAVLPGEIGELYLLGAGLAQGYYRRPDLTAHSFVELAHLPGSPRAYRTGDHAWLRADGQLVFVGRQDDEFKLSGQRISPTEIESVLLTHPEIREVAVLGQTLSSGIKRLVAIVVLRNSEYSLAELQAFARSQLSAMMVPSIWVCVERLPRASTGKIARQQLLALLPQTTALIEPSDSPLDATIRQVWAAVLGLSELPTDADFFALGGNSLQVIQVASRLGMALNREITAAVLFRYPTVALLSAALAAEAAPAIPTEPWLADAVLDPAIQPSQPVKPRPWQTVLLTGATGFVGVHVLAELLRSTSAKVICLVRAESRQAAFKRLDQAFKHYDVAITDLLERVEAWPADLSRAQFGLTPAQWDELAARCDVILHNAAVVSVLREYQSLRAVNVLATEQLIRLASAAAIPLHYVSTLAIAPPRSLLSEVPEAIFAAHQGLRDGYMQSKWASEQLLEQAASRGIPVSILRLGRVVGAQHNAAVNPEDLFWRIVQASVPHGYIPDLPVTEVWNPVDGVAQAFIALAQAYQTGLVIYNLAPQAPMKYQQVFDWLIEYGYEVQRCSLQAWYDHLIDVVDVQQRGTLAFFEPLLQGQAMPEPSGPFIANRCLHDLAKQGVTFPVIGREMVWRYLDTCVRQGLLPAPLERIVC